MPADDLNSVRLIGAVHGDVTLRDMPSRTVVLGFHLLVNKNTVNIEVVDPSAHVRQLVVDGVRLEVRGEVSRRFFRAGGATQSRTFVNAQSITKEIK